MATTPAPETNQPLPPRTLSLKDRCDRCGAQAWVKITTSTMSDLMFCAHHYRAHRPALKRQQGEGKIDTITDERPILHHEESLLASR